MQKVLRKIISDPSACKVLDPRTLGRPMHLLDDFGVMLAQRIGQFLGSKFNRRNGPLYVVESVQFCARPDEAQASNWHVIDDAPIELMLDRPLLLSMLDFRYGSVQIPEPSKAPVANTATEQRLAQVLGGELVQLIADILDIRIDPDAQHEEAGTPAYPKMFIVCKVREERHGTEGAIRLGLDSNWQANLFQKLAHDLPHPTRATKVGKPLARQLPIKLTAELVEVSVTFGQLQKLKPGSVLPIHMRARARVFANDNQLFLAMVAERNGKLCLTSFEYME